MCTSCKIWKKHWNSSFFVFFTTLDLLWPKFCPKDHSHFSFFWLISNGICSGIQLILITCVAIQQFWKKVGKTSSKLVFWTQFAQRRGHYGPCSRWKKFFLAEIPKEDHQLSKSFYFIKIYVLTELWIYILCFHGHVKPFYILDIENFTLPSYESP